ncbi:MAG: right-handed parallel beta-helix repeat-containing protein [Planctomycetes bacterium]|nr:right-handed parallel beta-helix repeat-containing protein [Planctomycetota bacterium]
MPNCLQRKIPPRLLLAVLLFGPALSAWAKSPSEAIPLPPPQGNVVTVADVDSLYRAVAELKPHTTILLRSGTYQLHRPVHIGHAAHLADVAIRGATGNFSDVVLKGAGMGNRQMGYGILAENTDGLLIADLTVGWVGMHAIALTPHELQHVRVYHCRLVDAGEQFVKVSFSNPASAINNGAVEYCLIEYTQFGPANGYTNGVDVLGGNHWVIRHNLFRNIRSEPNGKGVGPAVLAWKGASNTLCEQNTFLNCERAIAFGLQREKNAIDHQGGIIANNFIAANKGQVTRTDAGIIVWNSPGTKVRHNTILMDGSYPNAIEVRWDSSQGCSVVNNLTNAKIAARDGAQFVDAGNQITATPQMFQDPAAGNLHLPAGIHLDEIRLDKVPRLPDCLLDWDGHERPGTTLVGAIDPAATLGK